MVIRYLFTVANQHQTPTSNVSPYVTQTSPAGISARDFVKIAELGMKMVYYYPTPVRVLRHVDGRIQAVTTSVKSFATGRIRVYHVHKNVRSPAATRGVPKTVESLVLLVQKPVFLVVITKDNVSYHALYHVVLYLALSAALNDSIVDINARHFAASDVLLYNSASNVLYQKSWRPW